MRSASGHTNSHALPSITRKGAEFCLTDVLIGSSIFWSVLPETLTGDVYVQEVPLAYCLFYITLLSSVLSSLYYGVSRVSLPLKMALVSLVYMLAWGLYCENEVKFLVIDVSNFSGLLLGLYWAGRYSQQHTLNSLFWWSFLVGCAMIINILGLVVGFIPQAGEGERLYSYSLFISASFVTSVYPLWSIAKTKLGKVNSSHASQWFASIGLFFVVLAAIVSSTRSMFITAVVAFLLHLWLRLHGRNAVFWMLSTTIVTSCVAIYGFNTDEWGDLDFTRRLEATDFMEEYRFIELQMMFDDLSEDWICGKGFGSRFESCIILSSESLAYAPHIAVLTLLFKGGVIVFFLLIVLPLVVALRNLFVLKGNMLVLAFSSITVLYCVKSSMSGGWDYIALFLLGVSVTFQSRLSPN